ncbi:atp4 subunit B of the stator stalk of mitochondrial F1F0 ATP synthase, partial [Mortierella sp. AD094]
AQSIIDSLPGNSLLSKTAYVTALTGAATYLISKEIYVFNEESLVLLAFAATFGGIVKAAREPFNEWADGHITKIRTVLQKARVDHKAAVEDRIGQVGQMKDVVDVTKALYALSKETAELEAETLRSSPSSTPGFAMRPPSKIKSDLQDPKLQSKILDESISQVEKIATSAKA